MKGKRFTSEQIIKVLAEADAGMKIGELCRKYGVSEATYYNWKAKFGGLSLSEVRRLKDLEQENGRLKKLVADQALDIQMLKEVCSKNFKARGEAYGGQASDRSLRAEPKTNLFIDRHSAFKLSLSWSCSR